jgi:flagellar protein FliO/FliZ
MGARESRTSNIECRENTVCARPFPRPRHSTFDIRYLSLLVAAFAPTAHAAPDGYAGSVMQMLFGLGVVLALLIGGAMLLRRLGRFPPAAESPLKIVTGLALGPRDRLVVVQVGAKQVLLGLSPGRIQTLHVLEQPLDVHTPPPGAGGALAQRFGALLQSQLKK